MSEESNVTGCFDLADYEPQPGDMAYKPGFSVDAKVRSAAVMRAVDAALDDDTVGAVSTIAKSLGYTGGELDDMCLTWLRPITDCGWGVTGRGLGRARAALALVGKVLNGTPPKKALEEVGLTRMELTAFRAASPEFGKVYAAAIRARKEAIGDDVLDTATELATEGADVVVRDHDGKVVGVDKVKSERMLERLLALSGPEFQKGSAQALMEIHGKQEGPAVVMNFHFDRTGYPGDAAKEVAAKAAEVIDV